MTLKIKEMAEIITAAYNDNQNKILNELKGNVVIESKNPPIAIATALHEAGYRKQSDTVKEFAEKIKAIYQNRGPNELHTNISFLFVRIDELAAEYGVEDNK